MAQSDEEPKDGQGVEDLSSGEKSAWGDIRSTFSEDDLNNHEVCKMLARVLKNANKDLNVEVKRLKSVEVDYYDNREELVKLRTILGSIGLRKVLDAGGGVALGLLFSSELRSYWPFILGVAIVCFILSLSVREK